MNVQICYECAGKLHLMEAYDESDTGTLDDSSTCFFCVRARPTRELLIKGAIFTPNWPSAVPVVPRSSKGMFIFGDTFVTMRNGASDRYAKAMTRARLDPKNRKMHLARAAEASRSFARFRDEHHRALRRYGRSPVVNYA